MFVARTCKWGSPSNEPSDNIIFHVQYIDKPISYIHVLNKITWMAPVVSGSRCMHNMIKIIIYQPGNQPESNSFSLSPMW